MSLAQDDLPARPWNVFPGPGQALRMEGGREVVASKHRLTTRVLLGLPPWVRRLGEHVAARVSPDEFPERTDGLRASAESPKAALILVWLGLPPPYLPAFLRSARANPRFDWLIFADWPSLDVELPANVRLFHAGRKSIVARCYRTLGFVPALDDPNKLCDLRPLYWRMFARELAGYDYWGFCDLDCVWGDLDAAYGAPIRDGVDVVTSREGVLAGHFTVIRSGSPVERLAEEDEKLLADIRSPIHTCADEYEFSVVVRRAAREGKIRVHWPSLIAGDDHLVDQEGVDPEPWWWRDGRVTHHGKEFSYLHFMVWKRRSDFECDLDPSDHQSPFTIRPTGIS